MPLYQVHMYPIGRITFPAIFATSPAAAAQLIDEQTDLYANVPMQSTYADALDGFMVDTLDAEGNVIESVDLESDYRLADGRPKPGHYPLDERQHAAVLAALRYYQQNGRSGYPAPAGEDIAELATNGHTLRSLSDVEIDALCEQLNLRS